MTTGGPDVNRNGRGKYSPVAKVTGKTSGPQTFDQSENATPSAAHGTADTGLPERSGGPVAEACSHPMIGPMVAGIARCMRCRKVVVG